MPQRSNSPGPSTRLRSFALSLLGLIGLVVVIPAALVWGSRQQINHASPLHGVNAPWRWSWSSIRSWFSGIGAAVDTSDELVAVVVRLAIAIGWVCVAVLVVTIVAEVAFQVRHGMPSTPRHSLLGLSRVVRLLATGLVAILPVVHSTAALAAPAGVQQPVAATELPSHAVTIGAAVTDRAAPMSVGAGDSLAAWEASFGAPRTVTVAAGDSVWLIAERVAPQGSVAATAQQIVDLNLGHVMNDGSTFTTPALIQPGWTLIVPGIGAPESASPTAPAAAVAYTVQRGDSYWGIAEDHLDSDASAAHVLELTTDLIDANAPRLGYADPHLIHPGDVVFVDVSADADAPVDALDEVPADAPTGLPEVDGTLPAEPTVTEPTVTEPVVAAPDTTPASGSGAATTSTTSDAVPAAPASSIDAPESGHPLRNGLAGAVLVGAGALGILGARRRGQLRQAVAGSRLVNPLPREQATEAALRLADSLDAVARVDLATRAAARQVVDTDRMIVAAIVGDAGDVLILTEPPLPDGSTAGAPFSVDPPSGALWLAASTDLAALAAASVGVTQPCPALCHLGRADGGELFVDLEAMGLLAVGLGDHSSGVLRHIAASMAVSPFAQASTIMTVGLSADVVGQPGRVATVSGTEAWAAIERGALAPPSTLGRACSTLELRVRSAAGDAWSPLVAVIDQPVERDAVHVAPGRGVAVVSAAATTDVNATWRIEADHDADIDDSSAVLLPLGIRFRPIGLTVDDTIAVTDLLSAANEPLPVDDGDDIDDIDDIDDVDERLRCTTSAFAEPDYALLVRTLGDTEVVDADGRRADFERSKALELVVWLAHHRERSTRSAARTALWATDVRDATFANVVSDARRGLARLVVPADGDEWIDRTLTDDLPLHPMVVTDADLLAARLAWVRDHVAAGNCVSEHGAADHGAISHDAAIAVLRPGVELITGLPFSSTNYLWPDAEGTTSALVLLTTAATSELAARYLAVGDVEGVFWATGQGLRVLPGHEELIGLRMRAHARLGDHAGVRNEWDTYERALLRDAWDDGEPSPKLVALRKQLLTAS